METLDKWTLFVLIFVVLYFAGHLAFYLFK